MAALVSLAARSRADVFTGDQVYAEMLSRGTKYSKSTALKTMQRMKKRPERPPYARPERVGTAGFRLVATS